MQKKQKTYKNIILFFSILVLLLFIVYDYQNKNYNTDFFVEITTPKEKIERSLKHDSIFQVNGLIGEVSIEIKNKKVRVLSSECPDKICIKTSYISKSGPMIICAPNRVMVRILSRKTRSLVTY